MNDIRNQTEKLVVSNLDWWPTTHHRGDPRPGFHSQKTIRLIDYRTAFKTPSTASRYTKLLSNGDFWWENLVTSIIFFQSNNRTQLYLSDRKWTQFSKLESLETTRLTELSLSLSLSLSNYSISTSVYNKGIDPAVVRALYW